jgi:hypothetical protein
LEARIWDTFGWMLDHFEWSAFIAAVAVPSFRYFQWHESPGSRRTAFDPRRILSVAILLAVLVPNHPALSEPLTPLYAGNELLPSCRLAIGAEPPGVADLVKATYCVGVVAALIAIGPMLQPDYRFCFPKGASIEEAVQVVVAVLEMKPSLLQLDFRVLAAAAMKDSWPCKP